MHHQSRRKAVRTKLALLTGVAASLVLVAAAQTASSAVGRTQGESGASRFTLAAGNPLAGRTWGVYKGDGDQAWEPYNHATGTRKQLLAKIALRPKAKWFGAWVPAGEITAKVRAYIANAQDGDPDALVQMTDFALKPWEDNACHSLPSAAEQAFYKRWTDNFAAGLGDAHVALILQPDGPFALCAPGGSKLLSHLLRYAAQRFSAHPNTSVYIEAGASDWLRDDPARALKILVPAGVAGVRGFALNGTHYVATARDIAFGTSVVKALAKQGIPDKHFVINTSSNGRPFAGYTYTGPNFDNARVCASRSDHRCVTLGIPPTTDVANPAWGLSDTNRANAAKYVDGYLWFGRPWLYNQADPFDMQRALQLVRTTPY